MWASHLKQKTVGKHQAANPRNEKELIKFNFTQCNFTINFLSNSALTLHEIVSFNRAQRNSHRVKIITYKAD
jgi:hypothetical protein